jgi:predicted nucleic acid-binding Zn ribbon protein
MNFEKIMKVNENLEFCPICKSKKIQKVPTFASVHFKGSGWTEKSYQKGEKK